MGTFHRSATVLEKPYQVKCLNIENTISIDKIEANYNILSEIETNRFSSTRLFLAYTLYIPYV